MSNAESDQHTGLCHDFCLDMYGNIYDMKADEWSWHYAIYNDIEKWSTQKSMELNKLVPLPPTYFQNFTNFFQKNIPDFSNPIRQAMHDADNYMSNPDIYINRN